ncbi:MAG TPA: nucleotidyltransferase family protein [Acidimicrobiia bacterium]|nr:nucleotidyltransferase family protein [Acidimicrobiia bacterium]
MRRATITLPDDLEEKVERFRLAQPARPSLTAVVQAALEAYLMPGTAASDSQSMLSCLLRHRADIRRIVASHGGANPRLFGSVARGEADERSDLDILVDLEPGHTLFDLAAMRAELEILLGMPVDVVTTSGLEGELEEAIRSDALAL